MMIDITMLPEAQHIDTSAGWKSLNESTTPFMSKCERKIKRETFGSPAGVEAVCPVEPRAAALGLSCRRALSQPIAAPLLSPLLLEMQ